jgi:formate C-acetyltransferase
MDSATDIYAGGAKYNSSSVNAYGIASYVDSMLAVKRAVYDEKMIDFNTLIGILDKNWEGEGVLRKKIQRFPEKYGNGNPDADELARKTVELLSDLINGRENGRGGVFRLGLFSIDWIFEAGKRIGAAPDGRLAGEPVSKNLSTVIGMDKNGITAHVRSALAIDHTTCPNGNVLDLTLHPTTVSGEAGLSVMESILSLYLDRGGFALQFNVVSPDMLRAAQSEPEKYKNLQVRLCGWNVYFTDLEREVQNNLIESMVNL